MYKQRISPPKTATIFAAMAFVVALCGCGTDSRGYIKPTEGAHAVAMGKVHTCAACHGADGVSRARIFPNLAGQQKDYTIAQLVALRDHTRRDRDAKAFMWGMAAGLDDATIEQLAVYYASKPPALGLTVTRDAVAAGEAIYRQGVPDRGVLACVACHGEKAEGLGAVPRLGGQQSDYLLAQLDAFSSGARSNGAMNLIAKTMRPREREAVATYLSSL